MPSIHFSSSTLALRRDARDSVLMQRVFCTRYGLIASAADELDDDLLAGGKHIVGTVDMAAAPAWFERPQQGTANALSLLPQQLPRAVLWSAVIRCVADRHEADASGAWDLDVAHDLGDAGVADAVRACALAGLVSSAGDDGVTARFQDVLHWQRRRPWAELKTAAGDTLVGLHSRLPATARFNRRYASHSADTPAETPGVDLLLGNEAIVLPMPDATEFLGQQELELVWETDGALTVDLLVDGAWRPLPRVAVQPDSDGRNRSASQTYWQLSRWQQVAALVQVHVLDALTA